MEELWIDGSDKALRVARVTSMAARALRDPEKARRWLRKPKSRFGGKAPIEMLSTEAGARLVEEAILQFEYGMLA